MKQVKFGWLIALGVFVFQVIATSCDRELRDDTFHVISESIKTRGVAETPELNHIPATGGTYYIDFDAIDMWIFEYPDKEGDTSHEWIVPSMMEGNSGKIHFEVKILPNTTDSIRNTSFTLRTNFAFGKHPGYRRCDISQEAVITDNIE